MIDDAIIRRQARILILLNGAKNAGLSPIGIIPFHAFAFLSNVLAPIWDMPALDGKILKRKGGPFYPILQQDLDRLVGNGMVLITDVDHIQDSQGRWRVEGRYCLNDAMSINALTFLLQLPDERRFASFVTELAYALSALSESELHHALVEDATYCDPTFSNNNVIDFEEWERKNPSVNAAQYFDQLMPSGTRATPGEKLHLYVRHMRGRLYAA